MNLEDLRAAQTRERATDGLQELRDSFYGDVADYIQELKDQREAAAAAADDPFGDPEVQELTDKIETAEQVAEAIYERRMGKLVKQASLAAAGMPDDANGLTDEERALYTDLVDRIEANKSHVLDVISGDAEPTRGASADGESASDDPATEFGGEQSTAPESDAGEASAAAAMGGGLDAEEPDAPSGESAAPRSDEPSVSDRGGDAGATADDAEGASEPADAGVPDAVAEDLARVKGDDEDAGAERDAADGTPDGGDVERTTVRVTDDVGEIFGLDEREYTLEAEDVVALPAENAEPLVEKGAAEKLD